MNNEINLEYTSAQKMFDGKEFFAWKKEDAPILVGINIRSPENIGGLIRLAGTVGCKKVLFATDENNHKTAKIKKTSTTGFNTVDWSFVGLNSWYDKIPSDYEIIALETTSDSKNIYSNTMRSKTALLVGDERYGIDMANLNLCHKQAFIPMNGPVKSLNVVQAAAIGLYEILRTHL